MLFAISFYGQVYFEETIYYKTKRADLTSEHQKSLDRILQNTISEQEYSIEIKAHSDSVGTIDFNYLLAGERAENVKNYLNKKGIKKSNISVINYGETEPFDRNELDKNRRVEINISVIEKVVENSEPEIFQATGDIKDLYEFLSVEEQKFKISPNKDTAIVGKQGTIVYFPANTFQTSTSDSSEIEITLKEVYSISDMIIENLNTTSDGLGLETGGMVYIEANLDGKELKTIRKPITLMMPTEDFKDDMQLFNGVHGEDGNINWLSDRNFAGSLNDCIRWNPERRGWLRLLFDWLFRRQAFSMYRDCEEKLEDFEAKYSDVDIDKLNTIPKSKMNYYVFNSAQLGWMNCDRFYNEPTERLMTFKVKEQIHPNTDIKIVYRNMKSIIGGKPITNFFKFYKSLKNEDIWIVALKYENDTPLLAIKETKINKVADHNLEYKAYSIEDMKEELKRLEN